MKPHQVPVPSVLALADEAKEVHMKRYMIERANALMDKPTDRENVHRVVWADLATPDDDRAAEFYRQLFGWTDVSHLTDGGTFRTLEQDGGPVASLYRLARVHVDSGASAHWIPYVSTPDVAEAAARAVRHGGRIVVQPQHFPGLARVCLIADPTGAILGLWQGEGPRHESHGH